MRRVVIIANRTVGGDELAAAVRERIHEGVTGFHLIVPVASPVAPAVPAGEGAANVSATAVLEVRDERQVAQQRLQFGLEWLGSLGAAATGELCTGCDTASTLSSMIDQQGADEVIVSTLPTTLSRWLHQDLPHRISRKVSVPVAVVTSS